MSPRDTNDNQIDKEQFEETLDVYIENSIASGLPASDIVEVLGRRATDIATLKWARIVDLCIKAFIVLFCSITPACIWGAKFYAAVCLNSPVTDDIWLNAVCLVSVLSVVAQFFDVVKIIRLLKSKRT